MSRGRETLMMLCVAGVLTALGGCEQSAAEGEQARHGGETTSAAMAAAHSPAAHARPLQAAVKDEGQPVFIALGSEPKTLEILLIAAYTDANGGMNFNGYTQGGATYTIPVGWKVHATFRNRSAAPHSVVVVEPEKVREIRVGEPFFKGASTPDPVTGTTTTTERFGFVADEKGKFAIACGFPGHAIAGHWLHLIVAEENATPSFKAGEKVIEAK